MDIINLSASQVAEAGWSAYKEKRLSAQRGAKFCHYRSTEPQCLDAPCVVGSALTDEQLDQLRQANKDRPTVADVNNARINKLAGVEVDGAVFRMQCAHDAWINNRNQGREEYARQDEERLVVLLLTNLPIDHPDRSTAQEAYSRLKTG